MKSSQHVVPVPKAIEPVSTAASRSTHPLRTGHSAVKTPSPPPLPLQPRPRREGRTRASPRRLTRGLTGSEPASPPRMVNPRLLHVLHISVCFSMQSLKVQYSYCFGEKRIYQKDKALQPVARTTAELLAICCEMWYIHPANYCLEARPQSKQWPATPAEDAMHMTSPQSNYSTSTGYGTEVAPLRWFGLLAGDAAHDNLSVSLDTLGDPPLAHRYDTQPEGVSSRLHERQGIGLQNPSKLLQISAIAPNPLNGANGM